MNSTSLANISHDLQTKFREFLIVDSGVADASALLAGLSRDIEILRLLPNEKPLDQIAAALASGPRISRLHILAHGEPGKLHLSGSVIDLAALSACDAQITQISDAMLPGAELIIYACRLADGNAGGALVAALEQALDVEIHASASIIGQGRGWDFAPAALMAFSADVRAAYQGTLSSTFDFESGVAGDGTDTITQTVAGVTLTVTAAGNNVTFSDVSFNTQIIAEIGVLNNEYVTTLTFSFGGATVDLASIDFLEANSDFTGGTYTFTATGGSNSNVDVDANSVSNSSLTTINLNWTGVTSFTITAANLSGGTPNTIDTGFDPAFDNLVFTEVSPPTVTNVSSSAADGVYKVGDVIDILVTFDGAVDVTGTPQLTLETGVTDRTINYASGDGTNTLTFTYTVQAGDVSADLDFTGTGALSLNGGSIQSSGGVDADLTLPSPGASGSLGFNKAIAIDGIAPVVSAGNIVTLGNSGTSGAFIIGDIVSATWNNSASGDNNSDVASVTFDFTAFGGGAAVVGTNTLGVWSASYIIIAGSVDGSSQNVSVTATDTAGNVSTGADDVNDAVDNIAPTVTDGNISISGGTGTGGAFKIGDVVTATWNNTAGGDNNSDTIADVTVDFSQFGGGAAVAATNSSGTWTATYSITSGNVDTTNRNVAVTTTDDAGNTTTTADTSNATVDNKPATVTDGNISISGASGNSGIYIAGDTVTATWNNSGTGDNNSDTIAGVTMNFSAFGGGSSVVATNSAGVWTATYVIQSGSIDGTNKNVSVAVTDNAGNISITADSTNATVDNQDPTVTDSKLSISGASGTSGAYKLGDTVTVTWNNTGSGDNNSDIASATVDFSAFGGGSAVLANNSSGTWTATYTIQSGNIDTTNLNVSLTATDDAGNSTTTADTSNATVDNEAPSVSDPRISMIGASGVGGAYIQGDTLTVVWDNTWAGDNNSDIAGVTFDLSAFNGGSAVVGTNNGELWTASLNITNGLINGTNLNASVTVTDDAGNTTTVADTSNATVDSTAPTVSAITLVNPAGENTNADTLVFNVAFTDTNGVLNVTADDFLITGGSTATVSNVASSGGNAFNVTVSGGDLASYDGTVGLGFSMSQDITDGKGNALTNTTAPTEESYTLDNTDASVDSIERGPPYDENNNADELVFTVRFDADVDNVDATDFVVSGGSTAGVTDASEVSPGVVSVTVSGGDLDDYNGTVGIELDSGSDITDVVGNALDTTAPSHNETFVLDNTAPVLLSIERSIPLAQVVTVDSLEFIVTFDSEVVSVDTADFVVTGASTATISGVSDLSGGVFTVGISGGNLATFSGGLGLELANNATIEDQVGNALPIAPPNGVSESYSIDHTGPLISEAEVNGRTLVLTFDEVQDIDDTNPPSVNDFAVTVANVAVTIDSLEIDADAHTVTLNLVNPVRHGQAVLVSYTDPTINDDAIALQDVGGNDADGFTDFSVTNNTSPITSGGGSNTPPATTIVDGLLVTTTPQTRPDGLHTVITLPIVTSTRVDDSGEPGSADIPLGNGITLQLPEGSGGTVDQPQSPGPTSFLNLVDSTLSEPDSEQVTTFVQSHLNTQPSVQLSIMSSLLFTPSGMGDSSSPIVVDVPTDLTVGIVIDFSTTGSTVVFTGSSSPIVVGSGDGNLIMGGSSNFVVFDSGNQTVLGGAGSDSIMGGGGSLDLIYGNLDSDLIYGNQGSDVLYGGQSDDSLFGGQGNDVIYGNKSNDLLSGGFGNDTLLGGQGDDLLLDDAGADLIFGGDGNDRLLIGDGNDTLSGGAGADIFYFNFTSSFGDDVITDFSAEDSLYFSTAQAAILTSEIVSDGVMLHIGESSVHLIGLTAVPAFQIV